VTPLNQRDPGAGRNVSSDRGGPSNLTLRVASASVLAPVVLAAAYGGGWLFIGLCVIAAGGILWEWTRLVADRSDARILLPGLAALLTAALLVGLDRSGLAVGVMTLGVALAGGIVAVSPRRKPSAALWAVAGVLYAGIAFLSPVLLRRDTQIGFLAILFLGGTVWMTDIFAYTVGRAVGGPLLWPRVSPNKTWAGAIGGLAGGVVAGIAVAYASGLGKVVLLGVIALLLSVLSQLGDLFESALKRHFGAKDTSRLIPGHGGLMDRLDGFLVAALAALLIGILRQGTGAPAQGLLVW
jgi:phosphatidate cytidylyltransferase